LELGEGAFVEQYEGIFLRVSNNVKLILPEFIEEYA
jgi:hypothetical protein